MMPRQQVNSRSSYADLASRRRAGVAETDWVGVLVGLVSLPFFVVLLEVAATFVARPAALDATGFAGLDGFDAA